MILFIGMRKVKFILLLKRIITGPGKPYLRQRIYKPNACAFQSALKNSCFVFNVALIYKELMVI